MDGVVMPPPAMPAAVTARAPAGRERTLSHTRRQAYANGSTSAFGAPHMRSSYNERLYPRHRERVLAQHGGPRSLRASENGGASAAPQAGAGALYRSNSSLELEHEPSSSALRREFGSHGSIDVIAASSDPAVLAALTDFRSLDSGGGAGASGASPRIKSRLQRLWDRDRRGSRNSSNKPTPETSLFRKLRGGGGGGGGTAKDWTKDRNSSGEPETSRSSDSLDGETRMEERRRRRALVHYDCQSLLASLSTAARQRTQLSRRRNTATGASAASMAGGRGETGSGGGEGSVSNGEVGSDEEEDQGDNRSNELVLSCPYFRNEMGGEGERAVNLGGGGLLPPRRGWTPGAEAMLHRPAATCGLSVLEQPQGMSHWPVHQCAFSRTAAAPETANTGSYYYKDFFYGKEHENWVGTDEVLGPVAVSVRRDQLEGPRPDPARGDRQGTVQPCYRIIIRSSELPTVRALILEESLCQLSKPGEKLKRLPVREILEHVAPELQASCLRMAVPEPRTEDYLMKLDEQNIFNRYKVGIMYCRAGQSTEEEMYNNEESGPALDEFLEMLGQRVRLKGFDKYKAGLDNKTDSTGQFSVYAQYQENEIMFHVSTMLQFSPNNRQQLLRKRYIGNDIVTIIFQEPGALPFTPKHIRSQFQHVFIVVRALNPCSGETRYSVAVNRFRDVPPFGPPIPENATFGKSQAFAEFLYAKVINAETAAYQSDKFVTMARRTRQEYLRDLAANFLTDTTLEAPQKFSIMSFSSRKKDRLRPRFNPDLVQRGAISWQVTVDDQGLSKQVDCLLGVSADTLVLAEESCGALLFAAPATSVLGWTLQGTSLRVYYHLGEVVALHPRTLMDTEELAEIAARLAVVSSGSETQELVLRRNAMGQLGFHVQHDGLVTEVESYSPAWQAGLRPHAKLVEICKMAVCTMNHDQMVDLLKTSVTVSVTIIPPTSDGAARHGCCLPSCGTTPGEGDYENVPALPEGATSVPRQPACRQQQAGGRVVRSERSASPPPPSIVSSGYGTGGSGRSFFAAPSLSPEASGTLSSSSSGSAERWLEENEPESAPPLPTRHRQRLAASRSLDTVAAPSGQTINYTPQSAFQPPRAADPSTRREAMDYTELTSPPRPVLAEDKNGTSRPSYITNCGPDRAPMPDEYCLPAQGHLASRKSSLPMNGDTYHLAPLRYVAQSAHPVAVGAASSSRPAHVNGYSNGADPGPGSRGGQNGTAGYTNGVDYPQNTHGYTNGVDRSGQNGYVTNAAEVIKNHGLNGRHHIQNHGTGNQPDMAALSGGHIASNGTVTPQSLSNGYNTLANGLSNGTLNINNGLVMPGGSRQNGGGSRCGSRNQEHSPASLNGSGRSGVSLELSGSRSGSHSHSLNGSARSGLSLDGDSMLDRTSAARSEDELSAASLSPSLRRRGGSALRRDASTPSTGSGGSSRTDSPRTAEARLRPGAAARNSVHRSSGAAGNLQQELLRLINPDDCVTAGPANGAAPPLYEQRRRELERRRTETAERRRSRETEPGVIVTTARPATVIASPPDKQRSSGGNSGGGSAASWREDLRRLSREDRLSPRVTAGTAPLSSPPAAGGPRVPEVPLPPEQVDWEALVDTATRAIRGSNATAGPGDDYSRVPAVVEQLQSRLATVPEQLQSRLTLLENELMTEQSKRQLLESQVHQLSSDNRRLQEESKQAAHQLRKFTEWFFNNIEKP